jgi:hypothetical protein
MIHTVTRGITTDVGVLLLNASEFPVSGVLFSSVTVRYRKNGATSFTTKALLAGEWTEIGDGLYRLTFSGGELDTSGNFRFLVTGGSFERHENDLIVVEDFQSLAAQIADVKQQLASKANINDADILFSQLELRARELELAIRDFKKRLSRAEATLAALRTA